MTDYECAHAPKIVIFVDQLSGGCNYSTGKNKIINKLKKKIKSVSRAF